MQLQSRTTVMPQSQVSLRERIALDPASSVSLHRQISQWVRRAILDGQLQPGQRLPSTRTLASELGVSRNTASTAYEHLHAEGYLERTVGSGTKVATCFPELRPADRGTWQALGLSDPLPPRSTSPRMGAPSPSRWAVSPLLIATAPWALPRLSPGHACPGALSVSPLGPVDCPACSAFPPTAGRLSRECRLSS